MESLDIKKKKDYSLKNNFITSNCLSCIEINAHSLISLIHLFHNNQGLKAEMFVPWLLNSQPCEKLFRSARSLTSTFSTVIHFSMYDLIHRLHRIEMLNIIKNDLSNSQNNELNDAYDELGVQFNFPINHRTAKDKNKQLRNNEELQSMSDIRVQEIVEKSLLDIQLLVTSMGLMEESMLVDHSISKTIQSWITVKSKNANYKIPDKEQNNSDNDSDDQGDDDIQNEYINKCTSMVAEKNNCDQELLDQDTDEFNQLNNASQIDLTTYLGLDSNDKTRIKDLNLKEYSKELGEIDLSTDSPFVCLCLSPSIEVVIKKSSLCWLLENNKDRISTDRLRRFFVNTKPHIKSVFKDNPQDKHTVTPLSEDDSSN
ncbi:unnamed protein product [Macrosiphum euphorbiae]|uniref:Uncharacterized protein n=1 Tax=Macrosiphum euphorbiae TaxID=13131 RepID=A0AAV0XSH4_9HEMI|nr:unnamed protein product [Macrosiphum euphorbiae]